MRFRYHLLLLGAVLAAVLAVAPAQAHKLTPKKAKGALTPVAEGLVGTVSPLIAQRLPGASVSKTSVQACEIKKSHRAVCAITYSVVGATTGETECVVEGLVKFKNARSRALDVSVRGSLVCFFEIPPP
jgi:uncharacterized membrane protein YeaQ/YmgE (transglycosylase-associated protein family)